MNHAIRLIAALAVAAGLSGCDGGDSPDPDRTVTPTVSSSSPDPSPANGSELPLPARVSLHDIDQQNLKDYCNSQVWTGPGLRWIAFPDSCHGEADWTFESNHTIADVPVGRLREGDLTGLTDPSAFTTDQGLPVVTWSARVWAATNEYTEWDEWTGLITVEPSAGLGNTETVYIYVGVRVDAVDAGPVTRAEFDDAVTAIVVDP